MLEDRDILARIVEFENIKTNNQKILIIRHDTLFIRQQTLIQISTKFCINSITN